MSRGVDEGSLLDGQSATRYRILRRVGAGGMSTVFAAHDSQLGKQVALKLLKKDPLATDDSERRRLRMMREAQALKLLSHENVVRVFDVGSAGEQLFITMELIQGSALREWIKEKPRTLRNILDVFIAAGQGLAAAHERGLVHRDFKPGNVLVSSDGRVVVTDFGLVRFGPEMEELKTTAGAPPTFAAVLGAPLTAPGAVIGTPGYMAPEQIQGQSTDHRTDQFSFCVALYEALYGERPFAPSSEDGLPPEIALALAVVQGEVRPEPVGSHVPPELRQILLKGLSAKPDDRFESMRALLEELAAFEERGVRGSVLALGGLVLLLAIASAVVIFLPPPDPCADFPARDASGTHAEFFEEWNVARDVLCGPVFAKDFASRRAARECLEARIDEHKFVSRARESGAFDAPAVAALSLALTPPARCADDPRRAEEGAAFLAFGSAAAGEASLLDELLRATSAGDDLSRVRFHLALAAAVAAAGGTSLSKDQLYARTGAGPRAAHALHALGHLYSSVGRREDALACFEAMVLASAETAGGRAHAAIGLEAAARIQLELGRNAEAADLFSRALALFESMPPDQRAARARVETGLAVALSSPSRAKTAAALIAEVEVADASELLVSCASVLWRAGELAEAERLYERAIALASSELAAARAGHALGALLLAEDQAARAVPVLSVALSRLEKAAPANDVLLRDVLTSLAIAELSRGAADSAITRLERALSLSRAHGDSRERSARIRFTLARALLLAGPADRARSLQLAKSALDELTAAAGGEATRARREEISAWVAAVEAGS